MKNAEGGRMFFFPAIAATQGFYIATIWWVAPIIRGWSGLMPFVISLSSIYVAAFLVFYIALRIIFWERLGHVSDLAQLRVFGVVPSALLRRTGAIYVDLAGFVASVILMIVFLFVRDFQSLFPLVVLCALAFFSALMLGQRDLWPIRRRGSA